MRTHPSHDDLAAFALGALTGRAERRISAHVGRCDRCATELRERLNPAIGALAESVEQRDPPESLRQSLMATVHQEAAEGPAGTDRDAASRFGAFVLRPVTGLAVVALAIAGVAGYLVAQGDEGGDAQTVALPASKSGAGGELVREDGSATLHVHGMDPLPTGAVYQVWVADPEGVVPSAAFVPHADGTATAAVPEATGDANEIMITREPMPGRTSPTLPPLMDLRI